MESSKESFIKLVEGLREAGISDQDIRQSISMHSVKPDQAQVWKELLEQNQIKIEDLSYIAGMTDKEEFLDEIMGAEIEQEDDEKDIKLSEKSKKLLEKIELLSQKIEEEKSPLKRHILSFQVKMLIAKIQREIDLQNLKASYDNKRETLLSEKLDRETGAIDNIASLSEQIKQLKRDIRGNEEYDEQSPNFMYPKKYIEQVGGIEGLTEKLKESPKEDSQYTAWKIESISRQRQELEKLQEELKQEQEKLEYSQDDYNQDKKDLKREETALVVKQKINVFSRIGNFFKNMAEEVRAYRDEKRQIKELTIKQKEEEKKLDEEHEKLMQELKEKLEREKQEIRESHQIEREEQQIQTGKDTAASFRSKMSEMAKSEEPEGVYTGEPPEQPTHMDEPIVQQDDEER